MQAEVQQKLVSGGSTERGKEYNPGQVSAANQAPKETHSHPSRQLLSVVSVMIALIFVYNGISRLVEVSSLIKAEISVFSYAHSVEMIIIGTFLLLAECKTPLFKQNVKVIYRPFARIILLFIFSIFLYTGATDLTDFYLVTGLTVLMIMISQCVPDASKNKR